MDKNNFSSDKTYFQATKNNLSAQGVARNAKKNMFLVQNCDLGVPFSGSPDQVPKSDWPPDPSPTPLGGID